MQAVKNVMEQDPPSGSIDDHSVSRMTANDSRKRFSVSPAGVFYLQNYVGPIGMANTRGA